jgi:hypothetical protein
VSPPESEAARYLRFARQFRSRAEVKDATEFAAAAYQLAFAADDGETVYKARACMGHMFLYRAEYDLAYTWYRQALAEAEAWKVAQWIGPAHHDCWLAATEAGYAPDVCASHGEGLAAGWGCRPVKAWRFVHDSARVRISGDPARARFLASAALSASWITVSAVQGADEYAVYCSRFERMISYASMVQGFGCSGLQEQWRTSLNLFDMAAEALGTYEGYALCLLDCADGTWAIGERTLAESLRHRAASVACDRDEGAVVVLADRMSAVWSESRTNGGG